ncbi:ornithine cyclodeaminase [Clostridium sporogenes]|jgi:ornithine cyclodeaminase|uniref:Ornithine cyclodeaminase n=2 Tax=Clostridium TaxID=1485 RepID=A0AAE4Z0A9_CLOSG|nr:MULTISPECIES: ornithine cyclodeaminase [Clostridium]MBE6076969.1 ornithine cyclodeaminase [Clostridium lundense]MDU2834439.1 ornithine cyclodeaminase [Clostridium botulinum]EDU38741.1 ornithine cyclodeaminase [Clostridium sporogenes ATCC 15579]KIS22883.1 ornithine cyclodeaminase [Clostridium botulinum B2 450]MCW7998380.1 ornithine cyclodeaminase [Clostridium sp. cpc1]
METLKTKYIDLPTMAKYLKSVGPETVMERLIPYMEDDYKRWEYFQKMPRTAHHTDIGVLELMPIGDSEKYSFKYVNGHPENPKHNYLTVMGIGLLAEVSTGFPLLLSELTLTTALRTAANSVMGAKYLARPDSKKMALIGNGCQSEFQALAFHHILGIDEIYCYDVDPAATDKLMDNLKNIKNLKLIKCSSTKEACKGVDIITTVTADKRNAIVITPDMVEPGMHINGVGGDCPGKTELDSEVLHMGDVYVEFEPQSRIEGEIQHMDKDFKVTEICNVIKTGKPIDRKPGEITIFDSVGFALEDFSMLRLMYDIAKEENIGEPQILVPKLENPKDLYSMLR